MPVGDGSAWDETNPTNSTVATSIDEYDRDLRVGVRSRMAFEHEWPSSQSSTGEAGKHKFITLQNQSAKPTVSGTQLAAIYTKTMGSGLQELFWENELGTEVQLTSRTSPGIGLIQIVSSFVSTSTVLGTVPLFAAGTTPTTAAGNLFVSKAITPKVPNSNLRVRVFGEFNQTSGVANRVGLAYFVDTTSSAKAVIGEFLDAAFYTYGGRFLSLDHIIASPGTTAVTFYARAGFDATGACAFNFASAITGSTPNGTACNGGIIIEEFI